MTDAPSSKDLVTQLREANLVLAELRVEQHKTGLYGLAADEIERLQAENLTLRNAAVNLQEQMERDRLPPTPPHKSLPHDSEENCYCWREGSCRCLFVLADWGPDWIYDPDETDIRPAPDRGAVTKFGSQE